MGIWRLPCCSVNKASTFWPVMAFLSIIQPVVILARVFHSGGIFIILSRVYQVRNMFQGEWWLEDIAKCQQFPFSSCSPITYVFRRIQTSHFPCIFPAFEHYFFPRPPSLVIKLHTYLDGATSMYLTSA